MKKTILFILALIFCTQSFAQSQAQILIYGNLNGSFEKTEWGQKNYWLNINPGAGYHISDRIAVGIQGKYGTNGSQDTGIIVLKSSQSNWSVGPFVRYTRPLGEVFFIFGQLDLGYGMQGMGKVNGVKIPNMETMELSANFYPSVGLNIHEGLALNFAFGGLNYKYRKTESVPSGSHQANLNFGSAIQIGFSMFFGGFEKDAMNNRYN